MFAGQRDLPQTVLHLFHITHIGDGNGGHAHDRIHGRPDIMAHIGQKFAFCLVGMLRIPSGSFRGAALPIGFLAGSLQRSHLFSRDLKALGKYQQQRHHHDPAYNIDHMGPVLPHLPDQYIEGVKRQNRHKIPLAVRKIHTIQMES